MRAAASVGRKGEANLSHVARYAANLTYEYEQMRRDCAPLRKRNYQSDCTLVHNVKIMQLSQRFEGGIR